ncbi:reverse transcriptase domain-containing protein [Tanacetum coccineum]
MIAPDDVEYSYALRLNFSNSNNDAEYEVLLAGLRIAKEMQVKDIHAFVDSKLVASQVEGSYEAKGERMIKYQEKVLKLAGAFNKFQITHIPRAKNKKVDALSKLAVVQFDHLSKEVLVEVLNECSIKAQEKGKLPEDPVDARTLMEKIGNYTMEDGVLYRKSYLVPLMRCIGPLQANYFVNDPFKKWAEKLKIQLISTPVYHPQGNGAVERANKSLLRGIKTRLEKGGSAWAEEMPNVFWAHRTIKKTSNGETPFSLTYGTEAVIPVEIVMPTHRTSNVNVKTNDQELRLNLDLLDEQREIVAIREARYKKQVEKYYNKKVRHVQFKMGEFVLRRNEVSRAANTGKLGPTWCETPKMRNIFGSWVMGVPRHHTRL